MAQMHLVLLKSKMKQRQLEPREALRGAPSAAREVGDTRAMAQVREAPAGVTWDPPSQTSRARRVDDGYPSSPSRGSVPLATPQGGSQGFGGAFAQDADDGGPLLQCSDCGRKFNKEALEKHSKICKKVFLQKRKQFNSAEARLGELDNARELIEKASKIERVKDESKAKKDTEKVPKWEQQSLAFRQAILSAKAAAGDEDAAAKAKEIQKKLDKMGDPDADMTKCPHCGRTFNKEAGERHIAICIKTFGTKPGGGRLVKGGGHSAMAPTAVPTKQPPALAPASMAFDSRERPGLGAPSQPRAPSAGPAQGTAAV